jgi:hypothetical protein
MHVARVADDVSGIDNISRETHTMIFLPTFRSAGTIIFKSLNLKIFKFYYQLNKPKNLTRTKFIVTAKFLQRIEIN